MNDRSAVMARNIGLNISAEAQLFDPAGFARLREIYLSQHEANGKDQATIRLAGSEFCVAENFSKG
jgi:hypothetical protein